MKRTLTIIKVVEENYKATAEDLNKIFTKYANPDKVNDIKNEILANNIMEEDVKLTHERFNLVPKQLILFKVKTSKYNCDPATLAKFVEDVNLAVAGAIDGEQEHPFLVMNDDIDVEVINLGDYTVIE